MLPWYEQYNSSIEDTCLGQFQKNYMHLKGIRFSLNMEEPNSSSLKYLMISICELTYFVPVSAVPFT